MVKVKICGITNFEDAQASADAGCDALGFVFYRKSPRYIPAEKAKKIIEKLTSRVIKVGVFVNSPVKAVKRIAKTCSLDYLQFHGNESPAYCAKFREYRVIKAFRVKNHIDYNRISSYFPFAYLFDTFVKSKEGGTGKKFDWRLVSHICGIKQPVFLSGGLTVDNVEKAINCARPEWVDVSTSLEKAPGIKDQKKVREFIRKAKASK